MLVQLHIEHFALIEQLNLQFDHGLNILTGETGAGKSIVIDAVNLVLGGRGSTDFIRDGHDKARVEALFEIEDNPDLEQKMTDLGISAEEDRTLLISRELTRAGKNLCRINGRAVTLAMYRELGQYLIDIYGQHDHQSLLDTAKHQRLLDRLGDKVFQEVKLEMQKKYTKWSQLTHKLEDLQSRAKERARELDLLHYQVKEIDQAKLTIGEEEELFKDRQILAGAEKISGLAAEALTKLYVGHNRQNSTLDNLSEVVSNLKEIAAVDDQMKTLAEQVEAVYYQLEDAAGGLRDYRETIEFNPARLEEVEERLDLIQRLKRKYGDSIAEIMAYYEQTKARLEELEGCSELISELQTQATQYAEQATYLAKIITDARMKLAEQLTVKIQSELSDLGMPQVKFAVSFTTLEKWNANGAESVEFLISPNPGEALKPIARIASGGELSRIMLAMKTILAKADQIHTLIFDEVDAGIGGRTAQSVGEKLALLGRDRQVICVTHSPQVTSLADTHFYIEKGVEHDRTVTRISKLDMPSRVKELARMLGGQSITETTLKHAAEMLAMAVNK